ncbi:MAG TPA: VOC family protein [Thermomicrobiaceae bacterium]|nr:VOC family protein [Thermomicrobiaceae bacterium]
MPLAQVIGFDHVNLKTRDMQRAIDFYTQILGLRLVRAERDGSGALVFTSVRAGDLLIDFQPDSGDWQAGAGGLNHVALTIEPTDLDQLAQALRERGVEITEGPVRRQGAFGYGMALYIKDPDGHGVELKHYEFPLAPS